MTRAIPPRPLLPCLRFWIWLLALLLAACQGDVPSDTLPTATFPVTSAGPVAGNGVAGPPDQPRPTPAPSATPTELPGPPPTGAPTVAATRNPAPTVTGVSVTPPAALIPPAPPVILEPPPYSASECSDRYPCNEDIAGWEARMRVPAGFEARYFARLEALPTAITFDRDGRLYVAAMDGVIYRVTPGGRISAFFSGLTVPTGLTFQPGTDRLYVTSRVNNVGVGGEAMVAVIENGRLTPVLTGLPCCYTGYHAANGISFGPDGYGYVGVGARADHGEVLDTAFQDERQWNEAVILRFSPDGREVAPYAFGLRNPYDHAWDSEGRLFATDNAPDPRPGWNAPDELHLVVPGAEHGYPWYECDLCFKPPPEQAIVPPVYEFLAHSSPTGIVAYTADAFPGYYDSLFVALWSAFPGAQKVMHFTPGGADAGDFLVGLSSPIDLAVSPDGQLYVADFFTGIIVAIRYVG